MERLEKIRYEFEAYRELNESDEAWLIEKVEEQSNVLKEINDIKNEMHEKIERYEKALREINEGSTKGDFYTGWSYDISKRALEISQTKK